MAGYPFETLSFSSLNQYVGYGGCELAWYYQRIEKAPPDRLKRLPLALGRAVGAGIDAAVKAKIAGSSITADDAVGALMDSWKEEISTGQYETSEGSGLPVLAPAAVRSYVTDVLPRMRPIAVQHELSIGFDQVKWRLVGRIDLRVESDTPGAEDLLDQKATASSSTVYEAAGSIQLNLYDLGRTAEGGEVARVGYQTARILKTKAEIVTSMAPVTNDTRAQTAQLLGAVGAKLDESCTTGVFLPTAFMGRSWKCQSRFCDFYDRTCPYGARARTTYAFPEKEAKK